jgi:hypothetical protein
LQFESIQNSQIPSLFACVEVQLRICALSNEPSPFAFLQVVDNADLMKELERSMPSKNELKVGAKMCTLLMESNSILRMLFCRNQRGRSDD